MNYIQNHNDLIHSTHQRQDIANTNHKTKKLYHTGFPYKKRISINPYDIQNEKLWKQSSTSLTRDNSPSHKIGNGSRFFSYAQEQMKKTQFLTLQLRKDISSHQGVRFSKSIRPDHFYKFSKQNHPSPASYELKRLLDEDEDRLAANIKFRTLNPQSTHHGINKGAIKGITIPQFKQYHKTFIKHSQHTPYQPQFTQGQPGPGHYNHSFKNKDKKPSYSLRKPLKRFNEVTSLNPGVGAYELTTVHDLHSSINEKGTIPHSNRTYLTKFNENPSPNKYLLRRFLEQTK